MSDSSIEALTVSGQETFLTRLAETIGSKANAATVFAEPITRDGVTVVPVARARWGFGGGSGQGFGGGGGMVVNPAGYLVIRDGDAQYHPIRQTKLALAATLVGIWLGAILSRRRRFRD